MRSEESKAQQRAYDREMTTTVTMKLNKRTDADILEWLGRQENRQAYLKELIREDIKRGA